MHFSSLIRTVALASVTHSALAANFDVTVGKDSKLQFDPPTLNAAVGDTVTYHFFSKNHSVTQSSFADPCHPLAGGFFSGFTPTPVDTTSPTTWQIKVNDTKPIWAYCGQTVGNHCQSGMVHAINAPTTGNTFDAYKAKAVTASISTSPPNGLPIGGIRQLNVAVGANGNLTFTPNNINELPGTVINFSFNPKNHSVVQSSFADPCHPLAAGGFSSGFIPRDAAPSATNFVNFQIVVPDTKPIWFYCAQTAKTHCQAGMVGSINAPTTGNTLEAFIALAAKASGSTIPPSAPVNGVIQVGSDLAEPTFNGNVFTFSGTSSSGNPPPPPPPASTSSTPPAASASPAGNSWAPPPQWGDSSKDTAPHPLGAMPAPGNITSAAISSMAGGSPPTNYNFAPTISEEAVDYLQVLNFVDNILLQVLYDGYANLTVGIWKNKYPEPINDALASIYAQAVVQRSTATDSLQHYKKTLSNPCKYSFPITTIDDFVHAAHLLLLLDIGIILDITTGTATSDPWLNTALTANLGTKSRMTAVVNMMQNHFAGSSPREVAIPAQLVYSYAMSKYVVPGSCPDKLAYTTMYPSLTAERAVGADQRCTSITFTIDVSIKNTAGLFIAWLGPTGNLQFSPVTVNGAKGSASLPTDLYGHVWATVVTKQGVSMADLPSVTVQGPEEVWVTGIDAASKSG